VYERGHRVASSTFVLFGLRNSIAHSRIGITVTRKCGNAVVRNRVKRLLREVFRRHQESLVPPMDLVVNARAGLEKARLADLEREFVSRFGDLNRRART
jgi:ribonuclease P protein component